jgi:hypothetical protein
MLATVRCSWSAVTAVALVAAALGGACTQAHGAPPAAPVVPERPGVYLRAAGGTVLTPLTALHRADSTVVWEPGPSFDGAVEAIVAGSELAPCTESGLAIYAVSQMGRQPVTGWASLLPENGARLRRISRRSDLLSGDTSMNGPAWMLDGTRTRSVCRLVVGSARLPEGQYLIWNEKGDASSLLLAFPFRVR